MMRFSVQEGCVILIGGLIGGMLMCTQMNVKNCHLQHKSCRMES